MGAAAPLISIPEAQVPPGAQAEWFQGADGARLRAALFTPADGARGAVVLSPGRTEPIEKYYEVIRELMARGFQVLAHDWRGQGLSVRLLSDRLRGHAGGPDEFVTDFEALLDAFGPRLTEPWLSLGHSMGGCLALLALVRGERRFAGAILTAPMLAIAVGPLSQQLARVTAGAALRIGRAATYVQPVYDPLADRFSADALTHDRARYDRYKAQLRAAPDLALAGPTWGWLRFALDAAAAIAAPGALESVTIPVSLVLAGDDRLVLNAASRSAARRLPKGVCVEIPGAYHEILIETDQLRGPFWRAFDTLSAGLTGRLS